MTLITCYCGLSIDIGLRKLAFVVVSASVSSLPLSSLVCINAEGFMLDE